jgi:hypothetical protein
LIINISHAQVYPNNEVYQYQDLLTPAYYNAPNGDPFREEVNKYVYFARQIPFQHPFANSNGDTPNLVITRAFGSVVGQSANTEYHNAKDMKVQGNNDTIVALFASIDGVINTYRNDSKFRDYLSITKNVIDSSGTSLGKIVVIYAHIDLNLDSLDNRNLNGLVINRGDTVSKHLYAETAGSAHLHYEIRYYRNSEIGTEDYYGKPSGFPSFTDPSNGPWSHGEWNPNLGYGFADPEITLTK